MNKYSITIIKSHYIYTCPVINNDCGWLYSSVHCNQTGCLQIGLTLFFVHKNWMKSNLTRNYRRDQIVELKRMNEVIVFTHPNVINESINSSFFFYLFSIRFEVSMEQISSILHVISLNHPSNHWHSLNIFTKNGIITQIAPETGDIPSCKFMYKAQCCDHSGRICVDHVLLRFPINWINTKLASTLTKLNRFNNDATQWIYHWPMHCRLCAL